MRGFTDKAGLATVISTCLAFALLTGAAVALAQAGDETVHACVKGNGQVRIVAGPSACTTSETHRTWATQGPQGTPGATGPEGPQGPPGDLVLVEQACGAGEVVGGITADGDLQCVDPLAAVCDDGNAFTSDGVVRGDDDGLRCEHVGADADGDGAADVRGGGTDCDDGDAGIHPGAEDVVGDGVDQDCDGQDGARPVDADEDGFAVPADCDDNDLSVNPAAEDVPDDGVDQDCDGSDRSCDDGDPNTVDTYNQGACVHTTPPPAPVDRDADGFNSTQDCDDFNPSVNPGAAEIPGNGRDDNCDGVST